MANVIFLSLPKLAMSCLRSSQPRKATIADKGVWPVLPVKTLLNPIHRQTCITGIYQASHTNQRYFDCLYRPALNAFARLVQQLPASEVDHHAAPGGLLDHALESTLNALQIRRAHMLPADAPPEDVSRNEALWTYAVFAATLLHDVGKIAVDQQITLHDRRKRPLSESWSPFTGYMDQLGRWYAVEFRRDRDYALHQRTAALLVPKILPAEGLAWLNTNIEVFAAFSAAITGHPDEAGVLGQIVSEADQLSVARNKGAIHGMGQGTYMAARTKPLHEKLLTALRIQLDRNELALNRPGAAGWLTDEGLWMMGTRTVSTLRQHLTEEGHSGVPSSNSRLFDILMQHGMVIANENDQAIWRIRVTQADWKPNPFTVLRFRPEKIWPLVDHRPFVFSGQIEIVANPTTEDEEISGTAESENRVELPTQVPGNLDCPISEEPSQSEPNPDHKLVYGPWPSTSDTQNTTSSSDLNRLHRNPGTLTNDQPTYSPTQNTINDNQSKGRVFYDWLIQGLQQGRIQYNHVDAVVHVVEEGVLLVSPEIFRQFLKQFPEYESWNNVQKQAQRLRLNHKTPEGTNIHTYKVTGDNRRPSLLKGFLITDTAMLFGEKIPKPNPYLKTT